MKTMKQSLIKYIILFSFGFVIFFATLIFKLDNFWSGFSFTLIVISSIRFFQLYRCKTNKDYQENLNIQNHDERNLFLAQKARSITFLVSAILCAIGVIVLEILSFNMYATLLGLFVCAEMLFYVITYTILRKIQ